MNNELFSWPLFYGMSEAEYAAIGAALKERSVRKGDTIFAEGDTGTDMFILFSGALSAYKCQGDGTQRRMFDIVPGNFFGEMSLIANQPRSATITAGTDSLFMALSRADFYRIIAEHPRTGIKMLNAICAEQSCWLRQNSSHLQDIILWGQAARRRAITDDITGLYNRSFLEESINERFRAGFVGARTMSLIMIDIDHMHRYNGQYGTPGGDIVIGDVAEMLKHNGRQGDIAARLSGDEFAVLLPDTNSANAVIVAEKIRKTIIARPVRLNRPGCGTAENRHIQVSLGISTAPDNADTARALMYTADMALKRAKEHGRNRVERFYPGMERC